MSVRAVLIGLPGSGKTTVGRRLAKVLVVPFADSDELVVAAAGRSVSDIFRDDGEAGFRRLEAAAISEALEDLTGVLSLGGGALTTAATREQLAASQIPVIWLQAAREQLMERVARSTDRPLLAGDAALMLDRLRAEREPIYRQLATVVVDASDRNPSQLAAHLAARLHEGWITP